MPIRKVKRKKKTCYQWGNQKVYCGKGARAKARRQAKAIYSKGYKK